MRASCRLTQLRCWVAPSPEVSSPASGPAHFLRSRSSVRLRRGHTCPLFLQALHHFSLRAGLALRSLTLPQRCGPYSTETPQSLPGRQDTAVPAVGTDSVGINPPQTVPVHAPHQRRGKVPQFIGLCLFAGTVIPRITVRAALTPFGPSRPRPRRPSAQRTGAGLCRGLGASSLPALAPPKPVTPPAPDRLRGQPPLRSGSLVTGRLAGGSPH